MNVVIITHIWMCCHHGMGVWIKLTVITFHCVHALPGRRYMNVCTSIWHMCHVEWCRLISTGLRSARYINVMTYKNDEVHISVQYHAPLFRISCANINWTIGYDNRPTELLEGLRLHMVMRCCIVRHGNIRKKGHSQQVDECLVNSFTSNKKSQKLNAHLTKTWFWNK